MQPAGQMVGNLDVVQVGHGKMGVAPNARVGQVNDGGVASVPVHDICPLPGQGQADAPLVLSLNIGGLVPDVVTKVDGPS